MHWSPIIALCFTAAGHASSFSPILPTSSPCPSRRRAGKKQHNQKNNYSAGDVVHKRMNRQRHSATNVAINLSGGAVAVAPAAKTVLGAKRFFPLLSMILAGLNSFYITYPLLSAVATCSVKGCLADCIAQRRNRAAEATSNGDSSVLSLPDKPTKQPFSFRRNAAYILYGGLILGVLCDLMYNLVYPFLFGGLDGFFRVAAIVTFDNMVSGPLLWLPPVYFVKAILYGNPLKSGFQKYTTDVRQNGLLHKYWAVWFPAQMCNFSLVPPHLRIAFMAGVSFGWMIILSCISSNK